MAEIKLTAANFENEVLNSNVPVVVDFWATWCGPCKMIAPHLEQLSQSYDGKLKIGKVNVDEEIQLASKFGISSIPTIMLFKDGKLVNTSVGYMNLSQLESFAGV
ncbi:MAG: thioredoxin [Clostridia bacterium]|nr:thioredoxin [Clostridia bacterium]